VETMRCHECRCTWRQLAQQNGNAVTDSPACPQCQGEFVERMSVGIAAPRSRISINEDALRQVIAAQVATGAEDGALTLGDLIANVAAFGVDGSAGSVQGPTRDEDFQEDPELREALTRSMDDQSTQPRAPPAASLKAQRSLREVTHKESNDAACPVCAEDFRRRERLLEMPCGHSFHPVCLQTWLRETNSCPVCRFELETEDAEYERRRRSSAPDAKTNPRGVAPECQRPPDLAATWGVGTMETPQMGGEEASAAHQERWARETPGHSPHVSRSGDRLPVSASSNAGASEAGVIAAGNGRGNREGAAQASGRRVAGDKEVIRRGVAKATGTEGRELSELGGDAMSHPRGSAGRAAGPHTTSTQEGARRASIGIRSAAANRSGARGRSGAGR
jgi:hypothetical protein